MLDYLVRFAQSHESFRVAEVQALADLSHVRIEIVHYSEYSPFAIVRLPDGGNITELLSRAILVQSVYELWGEGLDYESLHASVKWTAREEIPKYISSSFKFTFDSFQASKSMSAQREIINSFAWLGFEGEISLKAADQSFVIFEEYPTPEDPKDILIKTELPRDVPTRLYFGRLVGVGSRHLINTYSLKKRCYISTTSMDAELALILANMVNARPGSIVFDPFVGTGSLTVACAHFGAAVLGSDIDPRPLRGKNGLNLKSNFQQYQISSQDIGSFVSDLVNTPLRGWAGPTTTNSGVHTCEWLDGIVCDPPYGVREGLKTLGRANDPTKKIHYSPKGLASYLHPDYIAPRRQYSFTAILDDLLSFAAAVLVPGGRLSFWMPTADDVEETLQIPKHSKLELVAVCTQPFNKWSRRLLTYRKYHPKSCPPSPLATATAITIATDGPIDNGEEADLKTQPRTQADDLNPFRKRYFQGFRDPIAEHADQSSNLNIESKIEGPI